MILLMSGRRDTLRATLEQSIRDAALAELRRTGPAELSLREVAKVAGISPSGLYRYVEGRDGLLELLIADGFERFGDTVSAAIQTAGPRFVDQALALASTYRSWARENPEQFALILGSPVVGFKANPDGPTEAAVRQFGLPMVQMMTRAFANGELEGIESDPLTDVDLSSFDPSLGSIPAALLDATVRSWSRIHGLVILEAFRHLAWSGRDVEAMLVDEVHSIANSFRSKVG
jgi:AcrR family transcriptional regulator